MATDEPYLPAIVQTRVDAYPLIARLFASSPTLVGEEAVKVLGELFNPLSAYSKWVIITSEVAGWDETVAACEQYISYLSAIQFTPDDKVYTAAPAHILACTSTGPNGNSAAAQGLVYSNGAVIYLVEMDGLKRDLLCCWVERSEALKAGLNILDPT